MPQAAPPAAPPAASPNCRTCTHEAASATAVAQPQRSLSPRPNAALRRAAPPPTPHRGPAATPSPPCAACQPSQRAQTPAGCTPHSHDHAAHNRIHTAPPYSLPPPVGRHPTHTDTAHPSPTPRAQRHSPTRQQAKTTAAATDHRCEVGSAAPATVTPAHNIAGACCHHPHSGRRTAHQLTATRSPVIALPPLRQGRWHPWHWPPCWA